VKRAYPIFAAAICLSILFASPSAAQFRQEDPQQASTSLGESQTQRWQAGIIVRAGSGGCRGIVGYTTVPTDWAEQTVRIVEEEISPRARVSYKMVDGQAKQMQIRIPMLPSGEKAEVLVTFEVERRTVLPPTDTSIYKIQELKEIDPMVRKFLAPSPLIESTDRTIRNLAREIVTPVEGDWEKVEAIYDWVRSNVEYKNGPIKGALAAYRDKTGDCEELTSLFIALCRCSGIPARTVWVDGHCYPEFYMVDTTGGGHWFPCQAAGSRAFGGIPEFRPTLQKGDSVRPTYNRYKPQRYLADHLTGSGTSRPSVQFVRKQLQQ